MPEEKILSAKRAMMYVIGFVFNIGYAIPTYINSTFLSKMLTDAGVPGGESLVGIIYAAGSIVAIACFMQMPKILKRFGNLRTTLALMFANLAALIGIILGDGPLVIVTAFIVKFVTIALINYALDMFLESFSSNASTGKTRGSFLTSVNLAWLISPAIAPLILGQDVYSNIYIASAVLLLPAMALVFFGLRKFVDPTYSRIPFWQSVGEIWVNKNIKGVLLSQLLLQIFYAWMIIYMPIYLRETVGFDWKTIGLIFTIMLVPFVLLEVPLGKLADTRFGEKEILSIGFVIMAACVFLIPFVTDHNVIVWATILFTSRIGAAMVEIMADTYFFKQVNASNAHLISFARIMRPLAYIISPIVATTLFIVFDIQALFIFLGLLMLYGLRYSTTLVDTR